MAGMPITPEKVEILDVAKGGIVSDQPGHLLPPGAWTSGSNVRFHNNGVQRWTGDSQVFGTPSVTPYQSANVPGQSGESFWIYMGLTAVYVYDGVSHSDITRAVGGAYTTTNGRDWCDTLLAGIPILTNLTDVPQYWTGLSAVSKLANLPNWDANKRAKRIVA